jgi:radical SAM protein with 4Fe4S-binding SPASM domain
MNENNINQPLSIFWRKVNKVSQECLPVGATIELTHRCNESCQFCYLQKKDLLPELTTEQVLFTIKKLVNSGVLFCTLTGGEPFIRRDIIPIIEAACTSDFFSVSIFSNGILLDDYHIAILKKYNKQINPFRMTVFSHLSEVHDAYTGISGGLKKIIANGEKLQAEGIQVQLALPIMDFNIDSINSSISFFKKIGFIVNLSTAKLVNDINKSSQIEYMTSKEFFIKYLDSGESIINSSSDHCKSPPDYHTTSSEFLCRGLKNTITIDPEGNIHPCTSFRNIIYGSIFDEKSIQEIIMKSKEYQILSHLTKSDLPCRECSKKQFCNPCIGNWHTKNGSYYKPFEGNCNFATALAELYNKER